MLEAATMKNGEQTTPITAEEDAKSCPSSTLIGGSFTPTNHLLERLESFADFLLCNLEDWNKSEPPWPSPPLINFSGSDRAIKGRLPHRRISLSSLLPKDFPLFCDEVANSKAASLLSSEDPRCCDSADASASLTHQAHLAPSSPLCCSDHLKGSELVNYPTPADFSALPASLEVAAEALLMPNSHTSPFVTQPESSSVDKSWGVHCPSDTVQDRKLLRTSAFDFIDTKSDSGSLVDRTSGKSRCSPTLVSASCSSLLTSLQSADSSHHLPLKGSAGVTNDSSVIDPHLMCRQLEEGLPSPACPLDTISGTSPNTTLSPNDGGDTAALPVFTGNIQLQPEHSELNLSRKEGYFSREERVKSKENVGVEVLESQQHNEQPSEPQDDQVSCLRDIDSITAPKKDVLPNECNGTALQISAKNAHIAPESLILDSSRRGGNVVVEERERVNSKQSVGVQVKSSHQSCEEFDRCNDEDLPHVLDVVPSSHDGCTDITPHISAGNANFGLENLNLDLQRRKDDLLSEERENAYQNVGLEAFSSLEWHQQDHQLEEGELSDQQMDQSSQQSGPAQTLNDNNEAVRDEIDLLDACESTRQQSASAPELAVADVVGGSNEICLPRYFTRSSIRKAEAEESNKKRKLNDRIDENKKTRKTSRKQRKTENKQKRASKQVASSSSGGTGKDGHQGAKKGSKKVTAPNKAECTLNAKERTNKEDTQETTVEAAGQCEMPGNGNVFVPERKKGFLSSIVEGQVGLWTTDAGDDQILTTQTEGLENKKVKRTLTAGRKKAKQRAKHRKRAEKERALGIRKLVFKAPEKKIIKFCQFYIKGKCSKGTSCTFSHDVIPRTKSEMCKYYINRCCLKGDDCPFSHELSSFPCKYFHTKGHCLDGESCRFSHKPIDDEVRQDLLKKIDRELQGRQEVQAASDDTLSGTATPAMALIAENDMRLQGQEKSVLLLKARPRLRDQSSQSCKSLALKMDGPIVHVISNDIKGENISILRPDKEIFARDEGMNNSVLLAERKAASAFTEDLNMHRSPLLQAGLQGRTGATLRKNIVSDLKAAVVSKENLKRLTPIGIASMMGASGFSVMKSPKSRAMELLQASLEASQLITRAKSSTSLEAPSTLGGLSGHQNEKPKGDTITGFNTLAPKSSESSDVCPKNCLLTLSDVKQADHISKDQDVMPPVHSASTKLNLVRVKSDAPSLNKRPTVDSLLRKILMD